MTRLRCSAGLFPHCSSRCAALGRRNKRRLPAGPHQPLKPVNLARYGEAKSWLNPRQSRGPGFESLA